MSRPWSIPVYWDDLSIVVQDILMSGDVSNVGKTLAGRLEQTEVLDEDGALTEFGREVGQFGVNLREMAQRKLKVYGWEGWRNECPAARNGNRQTREVVACKSKMAVARVAGVNRPVQLFNLDETGNEQDIAAAMSEPGTLFWRPLGGRGAYTRGPS